MPTDILFDSKRHLLYVADFGGKGEPSIAGGGTITVINLFDPEKLLRRFTCSYPHQSSGCCSPDGSVIAIDKAGDYPRLPYPTCWMLVAVSITSRRTNHAPEKN